MENVGEKFVARTSKFSGCESLTEVDIILRPKLVSLDERVSPFIERSIIVVDKTIEKTAPVVQIISKVLPVETAKNVSASVYGVFVKK